MLESSNFNIFIYMEVKSKTKDTTFYYLIKLKYIFHLAFILFISPGRTL
jgi:hypothetical protein